MTIWKRKNWAISILIALIIFLTYALVGPGLDFFGAYRSLVIENNLASTDSGIYAPPWLATFLAPFIQMPGRAGYIAFMAVSMAIILFGVYTFEGQPLPILISAQLSWVLWWGQIDAFPILALALGWLSLKKKSWIMMLAALAIASTKPQSCLIPVFVMWWWLGHERWKALIGFVLLITASLLIWGPWPIWIIERIYGLASNKSFGPWNASLGLIALPLLIPALLMPLDRKQRLLAITATALLISPYMPYYSTLILFCFPLPWWMGSFAIIGYLPTIIGTHLAWNGITLLPIAILGILYRPRIVILMQEIRQSRFLSNLRQGSFRFQPKPLPVRPDFLNSIPSQPEQKEN
jgi:hypothetical protein